MWVEGRDKEFIGTIEVYGHPVVVEKFEKLHLKYEFGSIIRVLYSFCGKPFYAAVYTEEFNQEDWMENIQDHIEEC